VSASFHGGDLTVMKGSPGFAAKVKDKGRVLDDYAEAVVAAPLKNESKSALI
jgi:hypothetical protein